MSREILSSVANKISPRENFRRIRNFLDRNNGPMPPLPRPSGGSRPPSIPPEPMPVGARLGPRRPEGSASAELPIPREEPITTRIRDIRLPRTR